MGNLYKGTCFPSAAFVRAESCAVPSVFGGAGGSAVLHQCAAGFDVNAASVTIEKFTDGVASGTYSAPWPPVVSCDYDGSTNLSLDMFGLVAGFLVVTWLASRIKGIFWGKHESA